MKKNNYGKNTFRRNRILRKLMPGIRMKLAFFTGVFILLILLSMTFFNYIHEGKIIEEGLIRETENSLKLINSVMVDMENVRSNILLVEDMRLRIEEKKKDLRKFRAVVYKKEESFGNSFRSLGQKLGMQVKFEYHQTLVETYYSVYFSENQIRKIEKGLMSQLKRKDGQVIDDKEFGLLKNKGRNLSIINRSIDSIQQNVAVEQQQMDELAAHETKDASTTKEINRLNREIQSGNSSLYSLSKRRLYADRAFRNLLKQYFEYEFSRMEEAGLHNNDIRIISSDRSGDAVYDTGSHIRDGLVKFGGLLSSEKYLKERGNFFSAAELSPLNSENANFDYKAGVRTFHVQYLPVYRNPATFERINIVLTETGKNASRWIPFLKKDSEVSLAIASITVKMKVRLDALKEKKTPPSEDSEYQNYYGQYRKLVGERTKNFEALSPYHNEMNLIADYYKSEIGKAQNELVAAQKKIDALKASGAVEKSDGTDSRIETIRVGIDSLKDRIATLKIDSGKSTEEIGLSEKLTVQDAFRNIRDAALYDFVALKLGNQPFVFHDYLVSSRARTIEMKRWAAIRSWIYNGRSETDIPENIPEMKNVKTIDNGILSYSRSEAEEYMWKLDSTPLVSDSGFFSIKTDSSGLLHELLGNSVTGYNSVIVDKTEGLQKIAENRKTMLFGTGGIVAFAILLAYLFAGFIVKRINGIIKHAKHAASGDLNVTFPERGIDEIEDMGIALNEMMKGLREKEELKGEIFAAGEIQKQLLPDQIPQNLEERYSIGRFYRSMQGVGGDYYDFIGLDENRILFCIGDVSSHGVGPAMVMAMMRAHLHGIIKRGERDLVRIVRDLNCQIFLETPSHIFVTFFIGIIDGETNEIEYCSAGHMKPLVYRYRKEEVETLDGGGLPVGMDDDDFFKDTIKVAKILMKTGDVFFQYTDGVNEAMNDAREIFGDERLLAEIKNFARKKPDVMIHQIAQAVQLFTGKDLFSPTGVTELNDDIAMIALKRLK